MFYASNKFICRRNIQSITRILKTVSSQVLKIAYFKKKMQIINILLVSFEIFKIYEKFIQLMISEMLYGYVFFIFYQFNLK